MQLCQFHFDQKIARKKVARVNAALLREFISSSSEYVNLLNALVAQSIFYNFSGNIITAVQGN